MDSRTALKKEDRMLFPGLECVIEDISGQGSSVLAYTGYYEDRQDPGIRHRVLIRELFPFDPAGVIIRSENGDLQVTKGSEAMYAAYKKKFLRSNEIHSRLAERIPADFDLHINTFALHNTIYSVMGYTGGRALEQEIPLLNEKPAPPSEEDEVSREKGQGAGTACAENDNPQQKLRRIVRIMCGVLRILQEFHKAGYLHLDISPDNILLIGSGDRERAMLIDYNSVYTVEEIRQDLSSRLSSKEGYTAPEIILGQRDCIGPHSDLFSMTAVFWHCLSGTRLSGLERVGSLLPDPSSLEQYRMLPETVLALLRRILAKGLSPSPGRRYQSAAEMLKDLKELEERIEGRGITRWALWESGRSRCLRMLRENISLQYISNETDLFPIFAETGDSRLDLTNGFQPSGAFEKEHADERESSRISSEEKPGSRHFLLLGGGGTGKTTALYRIAWSAYKKDKSYREDAAAVFYISLYGYRDGGNHFLRDSLLEGLKFKTETDSMEAARRELMLLLETADRSRPVLLLLLDGFNETVGDTEPLLQEIRLLAEKPGVRILMTSRSDPGGDLLRLFQKIKLCRLDTAQIRAILSREGILPPESMEVFDLLGFPILLSLYIKTMKSGETGLRALQNREELLDTYFLSLRKKEVLDGEEKGIEAVFLFLLPEIAARIHRLGRAVTDAELLETVEKCYRELSGKALTVVFPEWIGRGSELRLEAKSPDEWYGSAVLDILHKRTGLLVRDEQGRIRLLHQIMEDYLTDRSIRFHRLFDREKKRQRNRRGIAAAALLFMLISLAGIYNYRMRKEIEQKHRQMLSAETEKSILEAVEHSEKELSEGDRREAVESAVEALLLSYADEEQAEQYLVEEDGPDLLRENLSVIRERILSEESFDLEKESGDIPYEPDSCYSSRARNALTEALGVYDLNDGYKTDILLDLGEHLLGLSLSPEGTRCCALCAWDLKVFDTESGEETAVLPLAQTEEPQVFFLGEDTIVYTGLHSLCAYDLRESRILWEKPPAEAPAGSAEQGPASSGENDGWDFFESTEEIAVRGKKDSESVQILRKKQYKDRELPSYDSSSLHARTAAVQEGPQTAEYLTDRFRLSASSRKPLIIYDRETGEKKGEFDVAAELTGASQIGEDILLMYISPDDGKSFSILVDPFFETLAYMPGCCDLADGELIFECADGSFRTSCIYTVPELLELAEEY